MTKDITTLSLQYDRENTSFKLRLAFGEQWANLRIPGLEKAKEVLNITVGEAEGIYVDNGTSKDIYWNQKVEDKITSHNLTTETLTKEELLEVVNSLY